MCRGFLNLWTVLILGPFWTGSGELIVQCAPSTSLSSDSFMTFHLSFCYSPSAIKDLLALHLGVFMIRKGHEISMERICCLSLNKSCCSSLGNVICQALNHWNVLGILPNTTKMEQLHHAHMTFKFILRIGEAVTINSCLYFALLYINVITKYRLISSVMVSQLVIGYLRIFAVV